MNKNYILLTLLLVVLFIVNIVLFYSIIGPSVLFYGLIACFVIFIILLFAFIFRKRTPPPSAPAINRQQKSLDQEIAVQAMRSPAQGDAFIFHKIIILIEAILIIFLLINMLFKIII